MKFKIRYKQSPSKPYSFTLNPPDYWDQDFQDFKAGFTFDCIKNPFRTKDDILCTTVDSRMQKIEDKGFITFYKNNKKTKWGDIN